MQSDPVPGIEDPPPQTVLVVDDEVLVRFALAEFLRGCGYRVIEAADADEAVEILRTDVAVDVLLTDVQMPGSMNGFGLASWARAHRLGIRIIVTSGHEQAAHKASDLCDDEPYIRKPYDPARLAAEIRRLLAR